MANHTISSTTARVSGYNTRTAASELKQTSLQPCPVCNDLECLCRPRFFAGQLLSEDDLNLLDQYIIKKNRLHNRYLHGWGVVCGMEVVCSFCDGQVLVREGFALSPCGDDIVLCKDEHVDVCKLIKRCLDDRPKPDCRVPSYANDDCAEVEDKWVLCVRYRERSSRGVMPLQGSGKKFGSGQCDCRSCGTTQCTCETTTVVSKQQTNSSALQCEPTVICEGYEFDVYKLPESNKGKDDDRSKMEERLICCLKPFIKAIPSISKDATPLQIYQWLCRLKSNLQEVLISHPIYSCKLMEQLAKFHCPHPRDFATDDEYSAAVADVILLLVPIAVEIIRHCLCSILMPPCPEALDDCVPLATITVRRKDCKILHVCNWQERKFATTFPALQYWLEPLGIGDWLREQLEKICCDVFELRRNDKINPTRGDQPASNAGGANSMLNRGQGNGLSRIVSSALFERGPVLDEQRYFMGLLGVANVDGKGEVFASDEELSQPFQKLLVDRFSSALLDGLKSVSVTGEAGSTAGIAKLFTTGTTNGVGRENELASLQKQMIDLQAKVDQMMKNS